MTKFFSSHTPAPADSALADQPIETSAALTIDQIKKKTVTGAMSYFLRTGLLQLIGLVAALILSWFFSPADFGIYGYVTQIIGLLVFFSDIGLAAALVQKKTQPTQADYRTAFTVQQLLSWLIVAITLIILTSSAVTAKLGPAGTWLLIALSLSFPLASLKTIPSIILERELEFTKLVIPQIFEQLVFYGVLIPLAWHNFGVSAYSWAVLARSIIGVVIMSWLQPWPFGWQIDRLALKQLLGFGAKFQLNDFLARIKDQLFLVVLGMLMPIEHFGYVQWAKTWSMYPYNLTVQNVMAVTFPTFSRLQKDLVFLRKAIEKSIYFITLAIFPLLMGMIVLIKPLTVVVPKYGKWEPAIISFVFFTLSIGWSAISTPLVNTLNAIGKINQSLKLMVIWTVLTWVLTLPLVYWLGFNGVAIAAFVISLTSFLSVKYVKQVVDFSFWLMIKDQLLATLIMGGVGWLGQNYWSLGLKHFFLGGLIISLTYFASLCIFGRRQLLANLSSLKISHHVAKN